MAGDQDLLKKISGLEIENKSLKKGNKYVFFISIEWLRFKFNTNV